MTLFQNLSIIGRKKTCNPTEIVTASMDGCAARATIRDLCKAFRDALTRRPAGTRLRKNKQTEAFLMHERSRDSDPLIELVAYYKVRPDLLDHKCIVIHRRNIKERLQ